MRDGLAQRVLFSRLQRGRSRLFEAGRIFALETEHRCEEGRWQLVVLGVGGIGMLGDRPQRAQPLDRNANDDVGRRHALGGADDGR